MAIRFGPAGIGAVKDVDSTFSSYHRLGISAAEVPFTYSVYIKSEKEGKIVGEAARKNGIRLSVHAPYFVNLNSMERKKVEDSKKRILDSCRAASWMGAEVVVFHCGFYGKMDRETCYQNIKKEILGLLEEVKKNKWEVKLAPETMGKVNVFGSVDEILRLVKETGCSFCLDFAHLTARSQGKMSYGEMYEYVEKFSSLHCHFSGIAFSEKGERHHTLTDKRELKELISALPKNKEIVIINESPDPVGGSVLALEIYLK